MTMTAIRLLLIATVVVSAVSACATAPTHPALREGALAELIPTRKFFVDTVEDFLARHLGGRSGGLDLYEVGALVY